MVKIVEYNRFYKLVTRIDRFFLEYKDLIINKKKVLKNVFMQTNTTYVDSKEEVEMRKYEANTKEILKS